MAQISNLTPTDQIALNAYRFPGWVDRSKFEAVDTVNPMTSKAERVYQIKQPLPQRFRRKDLKRVNAMANLESRIPWVTKGTPIEIFGGIRGDGIPERIYINIVKSGSLIIRSFTEKSTNPARNGKKHMTFSGTAQYELDRDMVETFDPKHWRDNK